MIHCPKCEFANPDEAQTCARCGNARFVSEAAALATADRPIANPQPADHTPMPHQPEYTLSFRPTVRSAVVEAKAASTAPGTVFDQPLPELPSELTLQQRAGAKNFRGDPHATLQGDPAPASGNSTQLPPKSAPTQPAMRVRLVVLRGLKIGAEYPIYEGRNTLGRFVDKPVDVDLLTQESVEQTWCSRVHSAITFDKSVVMIEDLNSLNGTWINGTRIHPGQQRLLKPNDVIQIGTVQLKLIVE